MKFSGLPARLPRAGGSVPACGAPPPRPATFSSGALPPAVLPKLLLRPLALAAPRFGFSLQPGWAPAPCLPTAAGARGCHGPGLRVLGPGQGKNGTLQGGSDVSSSGGPSLSAFNFHVSNPASYCGAAAGLQLGHPGPIKSGTWSGDACAELSPGVIGNSDAPCSEGGHCVCWRRPAVPRSLGGGGAGGGGVGRCTGPCAELLALHKAIPVLDLQREEPS